MSGSATASNGFFFSELYMKANTAVSSNVDYSDIRPFIEVAQDQLIRSRIGKTLYERLKQSIINLDYNSHELDLLVFIRPAVCYYTVYLALPFLQTKIRNKGIVKGTDNNIQTVSRQDMLDLRQEFLQMSNYYMKNLNDWLCLNSGLFPEYVDPDPLNNKHYQEPFDLGGFMSYKGYGLGYLDRDLILKTVNYRKF